MLRKCFLCLLRELRRILVVCPVTVLGLVCGLFCYDIRTSGGSPGRDTCGYDTYDTYETTKNPRLLVSYRPLAFVLAAACNFASSSGDKRCQQAFSCKLPARSPLPAKLVAARALDAVQIQSAWQSAGGYARAWPRPRPASSLSYRNMSPAGTREQDPVEKAARSRSRDLENNEARRCEDVNSAQKKVVYLRARRTLLCSIHR